MDRGRREEVEEGVWMMVEGRERRDCGGSRMGREEGGAG